MSDEHLVFPEQASSKPNAAGGIPPTSADQPGDETPAATGKENRGKRPGTTAEGEVTGSGASAGGGGNPEDIDTDPAGGGSGDVD